MSDLRRFHVAISSLRLDTQHRRRSGWNSGGTHDQGRRWIGAEWGRVCGAVSRLQPTGGARELPSGVRGGAPAKNGFWRFLKATERSFLYII